jgi:hypothetical protein
MKKQIFFALALFAALITAVVIYAQETKQVAVQNDVITSSLRSARGLAKLKGHHLIDASQVGVPNYNNIRSLAKDSALIVIGTPQSSATKLVPPKETQIITKYQVSVSDVLKGELTGKSAVTVNVPGGLVKFDDGTSAEMKMPEGWRAPEIGKSYVFFLMKRGSSYAVIGGPQGLFEIPATNTIEPQVQPDSQLVQKYKGKTVESFISEIKKADKDRQTVNLDQEVH